MEGIDQQKILETALRKVKEQAFYMKHAMVRPPKGLPFFDSIRRCQPCNRLIISLSIH